MDEATHRDLWSSRESCSVFPPCHRDRDNKYLYFYARLDPARDGSELEALGMVLLFTEKVSFFALNILEYSLAR